MTPMTAYLDDSKCAQAILGVLLRTRGRQARTSARVLALFMDGRWKPSTVRGVLKRLEAYQIAVQHRTQQGRRGNVWRAL